MILPDTSAWVEYLRATGSPVHQYLRELLAENTVLATTEMVIMEVLAGARDDGHARRLRRLLLSCDLVASPGLAEYEAASDLYRACRRRGETIRSLADCLIAVVALRSGVSILHADRDYDALARCSALAIAIPPSL